MPRAASNVIVIPKNSMNRAATGRGTGGYARLTYLVAGAYLLLMLIGTLFVSFSESQLTAYVSYLCETRITDRLENSVALTMLSCVFPQLILILLCSIFANSTAGVPFLLSILLFKGFYSGMLNASVVSLVGIRGLLLSRARDIADTDGGLRRARGSAVPMARVTPRHSLSRSCLFSSRVSEAPKIPKGETR